MINAHLGRSSLSTACRAATRTASRPAVGTQQGGSPCRRITCADVPRQEGTRQVTGERAYGRCVSPASWALRSENARECHAAPLPCWRANLRGSVAHHPRHRQPVPSAHMDILWDLKREATCYCEIVRSDTVTFERWEPQSWSRVCPVPHRPKARSLRHRASVTGS